jgi:hypothetical protein
MNPQEREAAVGLAPESAELVETYFARVHGALLVAAAGECAETVEDLRAHVYEELAGTAGTAADVTRVLAELGPPEALAAECSEVAVGPPPSEPGDRSPLSGTLLGMPYELRLPTAERVALRWWDPTEPNILVPRLFGLGWDLNFGAVAVKLGMIKPDDEDVPFASVPERWLAVSAALPVLVAVVLVALIVPFQGSLPARVAIHWGITGVPDNFASKESALILPVTMTLIGLAILGAAWLRRRPPLSRVAAGALATMLGSISAAAYGQQVVTAYGANDVGILFPGLAFGLVLTFVMLVTLARIGRAAEMRRDLDGTSKKGSVR